MINTEQKVVSRFFKLNTTVTEKTNNSNEVAKSQDCETTPEKYPDIAAKVAELNELEERQRQEATALYLSSPEATLSDRGDKTPPRRDSINSTPPEIANLHAIDSGIEVSSNEKEEIQKECENPPKELLDKFQFKVKTRDLSIIEEDNIIEISDEETTKRVETSIKKVFIELNEDSSITSRILLFISEETNCTTDWTCETQSKKASCGCVTKQAIQIFL